MLKTGTKRRRTKAEMEAFKLEEQQKEEKEKLMLSLSLEKEDISDLKTSTNATATNTNSTSGAITTNSGFLEKKPFTASAYDNISLDNDPDLARLAESKKRLEALTRCQMNRGWE